MIIAPTIYYTKQYGDNIYDDDYDDDCDDDLDESVIIITFSSRTATILHIK